MKKEGWCPFVEVISFQEFMKQGMTLENKECQFNLYSSKNPVSQEEAQEMLLAILVSYYLINEY